MPSSSNRLLASLSTDDFDLLEPHLESVTLGLRKTSRKTQQANRRRLFPRSGIRIRCRRSIQRQAGRGRIDWPRGHDGFAYRARQSPLAPCDLYSSARNGQVHTSDGIAQGDPDQRIASRLVVEVRAGVRRANNTHRNQQRAVQVGRAIGALAADGARSDRRRYATAHSRVFVAHAWRPPARRDRSSACAPKTRIDFVWARANHGEGPQGTGARGRRSLWHSRGRISPTDRVKRRARRWPLAAGCRRDPSSEEGPRRTPKRRFETSAVRP